MIPGLDDGDYLGRRSFRLTVPRTLVFIRATTLTVMDLYLS
jgi:hypothetical protein